MIWACVFFVKASGYAASQIDRATPAIGFAIVKSDVAIDCQVVCPEAAPRLLVSKDVGFIL